ncbi:MAG: type 4a pilus biogenesis protein PilO [Nitrospirae bacterium]|nr:type 4a pilus biogenesis protein PilO [Nitrospirota bacterium]
MAKKIRIDFNRVPQPVRYVIVIGIPLIISILFYFLFYKPTTTEIKSLEADIQKQEQEIANAERKLAKLPELKAKYDVLVMELDELKRQLPEEKEVSNLLKQVSDLGIESGLTIQLWKPANKRVHASGILYEIPVKVEMSGSYHNLGKFFSSLTRLSRIVNINNIKLSNPKIRGREAILKIALNTVTFSAIPEKELKRMAKNKKRRKK